MGERLSCQRHRHVPRLSCRASLHGRRRLDREPRVDELVRRLAERCSLHRVQGCCAAALTRARRRSRPAEYPRQLRLPRNHGHAADAIVHRCRRRRRRDRRRVRGRRAAQADGDGARGRELRRLPRVGRGVVRYRRGAPRRRRQHRSRLKPSETEEQMAVYIEYISRRPGVPLEAFHAIAGPGQTAWSAEHSDDRLILNIGRTWRLGSEPEYIAVWHTPDKGANRLGDWAAIFASGEADHLELPFTAGGRVDGGGFFRTQLEAGTGSGLVYYDQFFDVAYGA